MYSIDQLLSNANIFLAENFPAKHNRPITLDQVNARLKKSMFKVSKESSSAKAKKSDKKFNQYTNVILYLVAADYLGPKLCVNFDNCKKGCLLWSGHGGNYGCMRGRVMKTLCYLIYPNEFRARLKRDLVLAKSAAKKLGKKLVLRLNGTTDLNPKAFDLPYDPEVIRYEYTKCLAYTMKPSNSHIHYTYSFFGNVSEAKQALANGVNVTIVINSLADLPDWAKDYNLINGDDHDLRFLDKKGSVIYLIAKKGGFSHSHRTTDLVNLGAAA